MAADRPLLQRVGEAFGRHRRPLGIGAGVSGAVAAVGAAVIGLSGAAAQADAPAPSQGRLLRVVVETRRAPEPTPVAYALLPTLATAPETEIPTDPDLASAQSSAEVQAYPDREAREQSATLAALARSDAQAEQALREAPVWTPVPSPAVEAPAPPGT